MLNFERKETEKKLWYFFTVLWKNLSIWSDMEHHLSKDFSLLKIDLPGHGQSEILAEVHTMELMAEEVKKVLDDHLEKIHLLGHSMGGYTHLHLLKNILIFKSLTYFSLLIFRMMKKKTAAHQKLQDHKRCICPYARAEFPIYSIPMKEIFWKEKLKQL
jgi:pimeloyl-ACP methyl ester carboxylesterase